MQNLARGDALDGRLAHNLWIEEFHSRYGTQLALDNNAGKAPRIVNRKVAQAVYVAPKPRSEGSHLLRAAKFLQSNRTLKQLHDSTFISHRRRWGQAELLAAVFKAAMKAHHR